MPLLGLVLIAAVRTLAPDMVWVDEPTPVARGVAEPTAAIIYLNMSGPTLSPGPNNSREDTSSLIRETTTFTPFKSQDPAARAELLRCTRILFGRFGITVTDVDPGSGVQHIEAVVTGATSAEIGARSSILGVSPFNCGYISSSIVYVFGAFYDNDIQNVCETVGQEVAHSFGLEHEALCEDPMTYDGGCGPKSFQDTDAPCGEYERDIMPCDCEQNQASNTQNSVRRMLALLGPGETTPPTVSMTAPAVGATVAGAFDVAAEAADNYIVVKVELSVDGVVKQEDATPPFEFPLPRNLALGAHELTVTATDPAGNHASDTRTITVEAECTTDEQCDTAQGEVCAGHYCAQPLGGPCEGQDGCEAGLVCGVEAEEQRCTRSCGDGFEECPGGFDCLEGIGGAAKCWPGADGGGGGCGCVVGGRASRRSASIALLGLLSVVFTLAWRRRIK